jgi:diguanylate cyclase (GGDEF)-like protein
MYALIPRDDHRMALRLRRQLMAIYSYFILWAGTYVGMELGLFAGNTPHIPIFTTTLALNVLIFLIIRSGLSRRFQDPAMTISQMMVGTLLITVLLNYSREMQGAMLAIYFMVMTFGVFGLTRIKMILMSLFMLLCFLGLSAWRWLFAPEGILFSTTFGHFSILALGLLWFVYVGGYIHNLQHRVRRQRSVLEKQRAHLESTNEQLERAMHSLEEIAVRDQLTGLFNRRHFIERLAGELARADRTGQGFHLALVDLDHFKTINDNFGHNAGDEVLKNFARVARDSLRKSDLLARYGGEEFIILFPDGDIEAITAVMERLREAFGSCEHGKDLGDLRITLSAGITSWRPHDSVETITERADEALYKAKEKGRNRIQVASA